MNRFLVLAPVLLAACAVDQGPVGEARATITQVPANVACVQVQIVGTRTVVKALDVTPGQSSTVTLHGLPVGADTFTAVAFPSVCSSIGGVEATWASDPVIATIAAGGITPVTLAMKPVGGASIGIDFDADGGAGPVDLGTDLATPFDLAGPPDMTQLPDLACVPMPKAVACAGQVCGAAPDGCGGTYVCGTCTAGRICCLDSCQPLATGCL